MKRSEATEDEVGGKPSINIALIWGLRKSSRLPFLTKEGVQRRKLSLEIWEETEFTGWTST